jgi:hypothetical protein
VIAWIQRLWAVALLVPLGAHAYVGWFSRYASDDYCTAAVTLEQGFLAAQSYWYNAWSGRYTFTALVTALELLGDWTARVLPALGVLLWLLIGSWAMLPLGRRLGWRQPVLTSFVLASLIIFATLTAAPNIGQSLYWQTGLLTYVLPLIAGALFAGWLLRRALASAASTSAGTLTISFVGSFVLGGLSETSLMLQVALLSLGLIAAQLGLAGQRRRVVVGLLLAALGGALAAGVVMLIAPGTRMRTAQEDDPPVTFERGLLAVRASLSLGVWIVRRFEVLSRLTALSLIVTCMALGFAAWTSRSTDDSADSAGWLKQVLRIVVVGVLGFGLTALTLFPVYLVQGFDPPGRVQMLTEFMLVVTIAAGSYLVGELLRTEVVRTPLPRVAGPMAMLVLSLLVVAPLSEARNTFGQVPFEAEYAAGWDANDDLLRSADGSASSAVIVSPLPPRWGWAYVDFRPEAFPNGCVARYYDLPRVIASGPSPAWRGAPEKGGRAPGG